MGSKSASVRRARGIDTSHYQGDVDFDAAKAAGVDFAIIKATEGRTVTDAKFAVNYAAAKAAGVLRGAYHYCVLTHEGEDGATDPVGGAKHFVSVVGDDEPELGFVMDLEHAKVAALAKKVGAEACADWIQTFSETLASATGRTPIIYWSHHVFDASCLGDEASRFLEHPLWWAAYVHGASWETLPSEPPYMKDGWGWSLWQFTDAGEVAGVRGAVDLDVYHGTLEELEGWAKG